jgi:uncharacterized RDD family membrane protein YckC
VPVHHLTTRLALLQLRGRNPPPGSPPPIRSRLLAITIDAAACLLLAGGRSRRALALAVPYHVGFWSLAGRTPGEVAAGIRLVAVDGSPVTPGQAAARLFAGDAIAGTALIEAR